MISARFTYDLLETEYGLCEYMDHQMITVYL